MSQDKMIMPVTPDLMIELEHRRFLEKLGGTGFRAFSDPMQRAIELVSRMNPNAFQRWMPEGMEGSIHEIVVSMGHSEPKIVSF